MPNDFFFGPGVFQFYLNLFVFMAGFMKRSPRDMALGLIGVLAIQSTICAVLSGDMAGYHCLQNMRTLPFPTKLLITALRTIILMPLLFAIIANVNNNVTGDSRGSDRGSPMTSTPGWP